MDAAKLLTGNRVIPVVVIDDIEVAVPLAKCLLEAGLSTIEITLRTPVAIEAIDRIAREVPGMIVGAGSIRSVEQVGEVLRAGAKFGVSPGATGRLLNAVDRAGLPFVPGAATASEMIRNLQRGYRLQKFFPAEQSGGVEYLKAVSGPLPEVRFVPTGGIDADKAQEYLALASVFAVGGSWITPKKLIENRDFSSIAELAAAAV
jgi:2-dehydro-3-deoxyphosphogluconate aldolase/(4S)-4-hydroxy-2-oxoglutarate aldolase